MTWLRKSRSWIRFRRWLRDYWHVVKPVSIGLVLLGLAWFVWHEFRDLNLAKIGESLLSIPPWKIGAAIGLTAVNYVILMAYDWTALTYLRHPLKLRQIALASFVGYAIGYNLGWFLGGTSVRYRIYTTWGISPAEIVKLVAILGVTFTIGFFALAGLAFLIEPLQIPPGIDLWFIPRAIKPFVASTRPIGVVLLAITGMYLTACGLRRTPLFFAERWRIPLPPLRLAFLQIFIASLDLLVAAGVLYVLLPQSAQVSFWKFIPSFLLAMGGVIIANVPGGVGVFEGIMLVQYGGNNRDEVAAALLAYRGIYYLLPLVVAVMIFGGYELMYKFTVRPRQ